MITVDFETKAIANRPNFPPAPVGVSIKYADRKSIYWGFGHLSGGNNCTEATARAELERAWSYGEPMLFHNASFDLSVAHEKWDLPLPSWDKVHDTMFLAYLLDPHARSNGLKPLAEDWLNWPPEERDAVADWIWEHRALILEATGEKVPSKAKTGAFIWCAPGDLVGRYACGDTDRTYALFNEMMPLVEKYGMAAAYDRERRVLPILMRNEREGLDVDMDLLTRDVMKYQLAFNLVEDALRGALGASGLNFDADKDVASVLLSRGLVPEENWATTKTGQLSMSKDNLHPSLFTGSYNGVTGLQVASALGYRNRLATCLKMFMQPWLAQANVTGGTIHTHWNQTRGVDRGGTRTGRPSTSDPNLLNISKSFDGRDDGYEHPAFLPVPELPLCRRYIKVKTGKRFNHRDFSGQELRIFADFEQGDLHGKYRADPNLDPHAFVGEELMRVAHREIERTRVKTLNFQGLYGGGVPALQRKLRCSLAEAKELKAFHDKALPGRKMLGDEIKRIIGRGLPIRTLGGRLYYAEPPGPDGRSKVYKLTNYIIQGSAADYTKEAMIEWDDWNSSLPRDAQGRFLIQVYDELNVEVPDHLAKAHMIEQKRIMERPGRLGLTVPMLSDGKWGPSWGDVVKLKPEDLL